MPAPWKGDLVRVVHTIAFFQLANYSTVYAGWPLKAIRKLQIVQDIPVRQAVGLATKST